MFITTAKKSTEGIYAALEGDISKCVEFHPDFENLCGYTTPDKNKIREAVLWAGKTDVDRIPKEFTTILEFLLPPKVAAIEAIKAE